MSALARHAAEIAARTSFGRLSSWLAWQWRDIAAAEDALAEALLKALEVWPVEGVPQSPDAWLLAVAKRELLQIARHDRVRLDSATTLILQLEDEAHTAPDIPDARLRLMFVCAHPSIDERIRTPLMLQTVLGLQARDIAAALLVSPTTLAQRLVRAKQKIKENALRFEEPEARELPDRLHHVLESIYAAYGLSLESVEGAEDRVTDLSGEALFLGDLVCRLLPESAEAAGLMALMLFKESRKPARYDVHGNFVPLTRQDVALWNRSAMVHADHILWAAAKLRQPGPLQLEAAIESAHCHRLFFGQTPWPAIKDLYAQLNVHYPTLGSLVAETVAIKKCGNPGLALERLDAMDVSLTQAFQPWWVARGNVLAALDRPDEAVATLGIAIGLTEQPSLKRYLTQVRQEILGTRATETRTCP